MPEGSKFFSDAVIIIIVIIVIINITVIDSSIPTTQQAKLDLVSSEMGCAKRVVSTLRHYSHHHVAVFALTFLSYAVLHATRKSFSNVKTTMSSVWTPSFRSDNWTHSSSSSHAQGREEKPSPFSTEVGLTPAGMWTDHDMFMDPDGAEQFMGSLDASFMFAYALGLFFSGFIADRSDMRVMLSLGMAVTALTVFVFGFLFERLSWYSKPAYVVVWILNGFFQSTGWPCVVAIMGNWFGKDSRGLVLGVWSACASVGNILGSVLVSAVLDYGYDFSFLVTACVLMSVAIVNMLGLLTSPTEIGLQMSPEAADDDDDDDVSISSSSSGGSCGSNSDAESGMMTGVTILGTGGGGLEIGKASDNSIIITVIPDSSSVGRRSSRSSFTEGQEEGMMTRMERLPSITITGIKEGLHPHHHHGGESESGDRSLFYLRDRDSKSKTGRIRSLSEGHVSRRQSRHHQHHHHHHHHHHHGRVSNERQEYSSRHGSRPRRYSERPTTQHRASQDYYDRYSRRYHSSSGSMDRDGGSMLGARSSRSSSRGSSSRGSSRRSSRESSIGRSRGRSVDHKYGHRHLDHRRSSVHGDRREDTPLQNFPTVQIRLQGDDSGHSTLEISPRVNNLPALLVTPPVPEECPPAEDCRPQKSGEDEDQNLPQQNCLPAPSSSTSADHNTDVTCDDKKDDDDVDVDKTEEKNPGDNSNDDNDNRSKENDPDDKDDDDNVRRRKKNYDTDDNDSSKTKKDDFNDNVHHNKSNNVNNDLGDDILKGSDNDKEKSDETRKNSVAKGEEGDDIDDDNNDNNDDDDNDGGGGGEVQPVNFLTALLLPGVVPYALCYAFLKLVNYSFFFWLPFYLSSAYGMAETVADRLSIWYDLGGVVGGTFAGFLSDRVGSRTVVVTPMLLLAVPLLFVYGMTGVAGSLVNNGLLLFVLGSLIGGVANLISAAISADLGRQKALRGNPKALSTVTGILDGTGSTGAALGQVAVPQLQVVWGWRTVFYLFMVCTALTAVCIARIFWTEAKQLARRFKQRP